MIRAGRRLLAYMPSPGRLTSEAHFCAMLPAGARIPYEKTMVRCPLRPQHMKLNYANPRLLQQIVSSSSSSSSSTDKQIEGMGLFQKIKFYFKKYWYIAVPIHCVSCSLWFAGLYLAVRGGVDIVATLELLHIPHSWIEKIKNTPASAGHFVVAAILYKIATPGRYATTLAGIQLAFWILRRR